jgi:hypothetical protein
MIPITRFDISFVTSIGLSLTWSTWGPYPITLWLGLPFCSIQFGIGPDSRTPAVKL